MIHGSRHIYWHVVGSVLTKIPRVMGSTSEVVHNIRPWKQRATQLPGDRFLERNYHPNTHCRVVIYLILSPYCHHQFVSKHRVTRRACGKVAAMLMSLDSHPWILSNSAFRL